MGTSKMKKKDHHACYGPSSSSIDIVRKNAI